MTSRPPVSIVILAWNSWPTTKVCLDTLRPTLGPRDQVIVVDNGSVDETPQLLARYPWIEVVGNPTNRGFAGGCNDGAAVAHNDILLFLNNDTALAHRWIDPLAAALDDPQVGAAGPRSNFVSGLQLVQDARYKTMADMRTFARTWSQAHRSQQTDTNRLVGFCLAVRRSLFEDLGRFDEGYGIGGFEDDDLSARITDAGYRLVICHDSYVHHEGHKTFDANGLDWLAEQESNRDRFVSSYRDLADSRHAPLISACLIVKDEEEDLAGCLASTDGVVDEIVVYDTGSTDGTVELARSLGATVVEGYWDDDFSRARNAALDHCTGEWILWVDADETLDTPDRDDLRRYLRQASPAVDAFSVPIDNLTGTGGESRFIHNASRLFRRERCHWSGRLHEQVMRFDEEPIRLAQLEHPSKLIHTGYLRGAIVARNKADRNIRVAQAEVDRSDGWDRAYSLVTLARSLHLAGRPDEALVNLKEALTLTDNEKTIRLALRTGVACAINTVDLDLALDWALRLREEGCDPNAADITEGGVRTTRGDFAEAVALYERIDPERPDPDGFSTAPGAVRALHATALAGLERWGEAADILLTEMRRNGLLETHLGNLVDYLVNAGRPLSEVIEAIPESRVAVFFAQILQLESAAADSLLEACLACGRHQNAALATASTLAQRLPLDRTLMWSAQLRQAGHDRACPLVAIATRSEENPVLRARCAAAAAGAFNDDRAVAAFSLVYGAATLEEQETIRAEAAQLCPALLVTAA